MFLSLSIISQVNAFRPFKKFLNHYASFVTVALRVNNNPGSILAAFERETDVRVQKTVGKTKDMTFVIPCSRRYAWNMKKLILP